MVNLHPDVVAGIDFGMIGTAVSYAKRADDKPMVIVKWTIGESEYNESKVPTLVAYYRDGFFYWGFAARELSATLYDSGQTNGPAPQPTARDLSGVTECRTVKHFKLGIVDSGPYADRDGACAQYFLQELKTFIEAYLKKRQFLVDDGVVKYLFSYPTTWKDQRTMPLLQSIIQNAGYKLVPGQDSFLSLDEANAAMAFFHATDNRKPNSGDLVLVADIGGATSDVCVAEVNYNAGNALTIKTPGIGDILAPHASTRVSKRNLESIFMKKRLSIGYVLTPPVLTTKLMRRSPLTSYSQITNATSMILLEPEGKIS